MIEKVAPRIYFNMLLLVLIPGVGPLSKRMMKGKSLVPRALHS